MLYVGHEDHGTREPRLIPGQMSIVAWDPLGGALEVRFDPGLLAADRPVREPCRQSSQTEHVQQGGSVFRPQTDL